MLLSDSTRQTGALYLCLVAQFFSVNQRISLHLLSLVASGAFTDECYGTVANGETVLSCLPPLGNSADGRLKYIHPSLYVEAYFLVLELQPKGWASDMKQV